MNGKRRDLIMVAIVYPVVVALGAMMLSDGAVLLGVTQIAVGLGFMGLRLSSMIKQKNVNP